MKVSIELEEDAVKAIEEFIVAYMETVGQHQYKEEETVFVPLPYSLARAFHFGLIHGTILTAKS